MPLWSSGCGVVTVGCGENVYQKNAISFLFADNKPESDSEE